VKTTLTILTNLAIFYVGRQIKLAVSAINIESDLGDGNEVE
jgi:hypothetical protein